jgi:hypothetical protein
MLERKRRTCLRNDPYDISPVHSSTSRSVRHVPGSYKQVLQCHAILAFDTRSTRLARGPGNRRYSLAIRLQLHLIRSAFDVGYRSVQSQNGQDRGVHAPLLLGADTPGRTPEAPDVNGSHLFHENSRLDAFDLDLGSERGASCARGRGSDQDKGSGEKGIGLDNHPVALPVLFVSGAFGKPKPEDVTPAHADSPSSRPLRASRQGPLGLPRALPPHRLEHSCRSASRLLPREPNVSPPSESYLLLPVVREPALLRRLDEQKLPEPCRQCITLRNTGVRWAIQPHG